MKIKLADFGLATRIKAGEALKQRCGTPGYIAPEILTGEAYNEKIDIYSCGMILQLMYYYNINRLKKRILPDTEANTIRKYKTYNSTIFKPYPIAVECNFRVGSISRRIDK